MSGTRGRDPTESAASLRAAQTLTDIELFWPPDDYPARRALRLAAEAAHQRAIALRPVPVPEPVTVPVTEPVDEVARLWLAVLVLCRTRSAVWRVAGGERVPPADLEPIIARAVLRSGWPYRDAPPSRSAPWIEVPISALIETAPVIEEYLSRRHAVRVTRDAEDAA